nr:hypothetical protein [Deltaproteobacteria bacterium]
IIVASRGGDATKKAIEPDKVVIHATEPAPPPTPARVDPPVETKPVDPPPVVVESSKTKPAETKPIKKPVVKTVTKPAETKPPEIAQPVEPAKLPEVTKPEVTKPAETAKPPDGFDITYAAVARDLRALGDKAADLWPKFRLIRYNDAVSSPEKLAEAKAILADLRKTIATRRR